ncbi:MAG: Uma2 family endonuclease [Firmicutes bacterium]|nr:Uma2 family endonuclease [Bacillota bacterium]
MATVQIQRPVHYPESDGKPMAETPEHLEAMLYLIDALKRYFAARDDVYVAGNQFLYWVEGNPSQRVAPDVYVAFGVPKRPWRATWKVWEIGKAPDVIIELTSRSTAGEDLDRKYRLYQRLGVKEYILIDVRREYLIEPVILHRLAGGAYQQIPTAHPGDREWRARSELLGLEVVVRAEDDGYLVRLYDPVRGRIIPTAVELEERATEMETRLRELEAKLRQREESAE